MSFASANRAHADSCGLVPDRRAARGAGELGEEAEQRDVRVQLVDRDLAGLPTVAADDGSFEQAANSTTTHRVASTRRGRGTGITGPS